ncbi:MAG: hypothetical protein QOD99_2849 [Chthoniobacter sp.]|jgi:hypothetical protein|nr:hypothetical protein [Chthoniobacter sp.]
MKLSGRERLLATVVIGAVFIVLNLVLFKTFLRKQSDLRQQLTSRKAELNSMQILLSERDLWKERDAWLAATQPKMANENTAGVELLETIRALAKKHDVTLERPALASPGRTQWYRSASVTLETKSSWQNLIGFLQELQEPTRFRVVESANITIDATDQTQMRTKLRVALWCAL